MPLQNQKDVDKLLDDRALIEKIRDVRRILEGANNNASHWLDELNKLLEELAKRNTENRKKAENGK